MLRSAKDIKELLDIANLHPRGGEGGREHAVHLNMALLFADLKAVPI